MKTKFYISIFTIALVFFSCKKDETSVSRLTSNAVSDYSTDGVVAVQVSILPPSTPQTFIANSQNGSASVAAYEVTASKQVYIDYFHMQATYPAILAIGHVPNRNGETPVPINYSISGSQSRTIPIDVLYNNVDSTTSPLITHVRLDTLQYHTEDYSYHYFPVDRKSGTAFSICLVNNIAHITFKSPSQSKTLNNGYIELAEAKLTGDTSWTLNSLPLNFYFSNGDFGTYPTKIIVIYQRNKVATGAVHDHLAVVHFSEEFKHAAGETEILKIYGNQLSGNPAGFFTTEMGDLNGLVWKDGLGGYIPGNLNAQYYKEQTGSSTIQNPH